MHEEMMMASQLSRVGSGNVGLAIVVILLASSRIVAQMTGDKLPIAEAKELLNDYHPDNQQKALDAIAAGKVENAESLIPDMLRMLGKPGEVELQSSIASALAFLQTKGHDVIPSLLKSALGSDRGDQMNAIRTLARFGPKGIEALVQVLNSDNKFAQEEAAFALTAHSPTHVSVESKQPVLKELVAALYHVDANATGHLCRGLLDLGDDAVSELIDGFMSGEDQRRLKALTCLNTFGVKASKAVPKIIAVFENPNESTLMRKWSAAALGVIGKDTEVALSTLIRCLSDQNAEIQFGCVRGLGSVGPPAQKAVPALIRILEKHAESKNLSDAQLPMEAAEAIKSIGPGAEDAVPVLRSMLQSKDRWFQERAIGALSAIGPAATSVNDDLVKLLAQGEEDNKNSAAYALGRINPEPENANLSIPEKYREWFDKGRRDGREAAQKIDAPSPTRPVDAKKEERPASQNSIKVEVLGKNRQRIKGARAVYSQQANGPPFRRSIIEATSDDLGVFKLEEIPPGKGSLTVYAEGYEPSLIGGFGGQRPQTSGVDRARRPPMEVELREAPITKATVVDPKQKPVVGAKVIIDEYRSTPMAPVALLTDGSGVFGFWVGLGFVGGQITKDGFMTHRFVLDSKSKEKVIVLRHPFRITGNVLDADSGAKVSNFEIKLGYLVEGNAEFFDQHGEGKSLGKFTNGTFEIKFAESVDPLPGLSDHRVLGVEATGFERAVSRIFKEDEGDIKINFKLNKK